MLRSRSMPFRSPRWGITNQHPFTFQGQVSQNRTYFLGKDNELNDSSAGGNSILLPPSRLGSGDTAPRYPHMIGIPIISRPVFPLMPTSITLKDKSTIEALEALEDSSYVGIFLRKRNSTGVTDGGVIIDKPEIIKDPSEIFNVGTFAQIHRMTRVGIRSKSEDSLNESFADNDTDNEVASISLWLMGHRRIDLNSVDDVGPPTRVKVSHWDKLEYTKTDDTIRALSNEVLSVIREVAQMNALFRESLQFFPARVDANDPYKLADFVASITKSGTPEELQAVLEEKDAEMRLHKAFVLLIKEREVAKLQQEISSKVEEKMTEAQRKYFLTEQLKSIKKELGMERDDKEALIEKYRKQLAGYSKIPDDIMVTIEQELEKLSTLEKNSAEFNVTRSYLDWLCGVPWGKMTDENFDVNDARRILNRDHFGLDDVKDTILQFIAVGKLKGSVQGKILCLAGPPGTGKTSIAKSIADALGRKFFRFSVGGLSDVSEIKGHRRTYVGAMPGKLIQCLKSTESMNPVVLIDEIDKLGSGYRGDPASALLEVLDPSQNSSFLDHFLDVPVDISKVLFMCTANDLGSISGPLLDRMEVIRLSGYDFPEKVAIAEGFLIPKSMAESGLMVKKKEEDKDANNGGVDKLGDEPNLPLSQYQHGETVPTTLSIGKGAIESLVRWYCREAGVRNLAKHIDKITGRLALQVVAEAEGTELSQKSKRKALTWEVTDDNLSDYVGKPIFTSDRMYEEDPLPHGIVMGLAWTSMGGSALYIETQGIKRGLDKEGKTRGGGGIKTTGQLGDVMKESSQIAYTLARARLSQIEANNSYFDDTDIHMHVPEGATPKDGPSAGVTMVTSMLSLALDIPVRHDVAMTGEVSLTGKVLPVGGIKEKIMAARRAGIKCVIMPAANRRDFEEIPEYLKDGLQVNFAEDYDEVYQVALGKASICL
jgi:ATP-dependent Lon protease